MKKMLLATLVGGALSIMAGGAQAGLIWGNNASFNGVDIEAFDATTGAVVHQFRYVDPNITNRNGRGVVTVGNTVYFTQLQSFTGDGKIHKMDATTGAYLGSITVDPLAQSMSTIAWDGSAFWTSQYQQGNKAFRIDPNTGAILKTITLSNASPGLDGMEYFNGKLIANRCDACSVYDIYDLDGNVITSNFITETGSSTGIAFDGVNFLVAHNFNSIDVFDGTTGLLKETITLGGPNPLGGRAIEDLSVDYAGRADTGGGNTVPEPASLALLGIGLAGLAAARRRKQMA